MKEQENKEKIINPTGREFLVGFTVCYLFSRPFLRHSADNSCIYFRLQFQNTMSTRNHPFRLPSIGHDQLPPQMICQQKNQQNSGTFCCNCFCLQEIRCTHKSGNNCDKFHVRPSIHPLTLWLYYKLRILGCQFQLQCRQSGVYKAFKGGNREGGDQGRKAA